jgi:hypothetical protein
VHRVVHHSLITALNAQREEWRLAQGLHPQRVQMVLAFDTIVSAQMNNIVQKAKSVSHFYSFGMQLACDKANFYALVCQTQQSEDSRPD